MGPQDLNSLPCSISPLDFKMNIPKDCETRQRIVRSSSDLKDAEMNSYKVLASRT